MIKRMRQVMIGTLALASAAAFAQAQDTNTIGNPQLKNFELPGTKTVTAPPVQLPAAPPQQAQPQPQVEPQASPPPRAQAPAPPRAQTSPQPEARPLERSPARAASVTEAPPASAVEATPSASPAPAPEAPPSAAPLIVPDPEPQLAPQAKLAPPPPPAEAESSFPWLYLGLAALLALLAYFAFGKFRPQPRLAHARSAAPAVPAPRPAPPAPAKATEPAPAPVAAPPAAPAASGGIVGIQVRPWLELEFRPDRAAATMTDASVQYELIVRNMGNAPAHNIRIEARMFNAGASQEQEIGAFYAEPVRERTPPSIPLIPPRGEIQLKSAVTMPKDEVREINVQGRRLFIPMVAFNVIYDWGNGRSGQTSMSYLVGREPEAASEKMGAFRLDLGPRLYRSVGQRQTAMARIV